MLLSADWFLPHWPLFGITLDARARAKVQALARECVEQFVGSTRVYWACDLSRERIAATRSAFLENTSRVVSHADLVLVEQFLMQADEELSDEIAWILYTLTDLLLTENQTTSNGPVEERVLRLLRELRRSSSVPIADILRRSAMDSESPWDAKLKSLTPGLEGYLLDFLLERHQYRSAFGAFWYLVKSELDEHALDKLKAWYQTKMLELSGRSDFQLPSWM